MMSFDIKIDKDNILDALSIYHNLPMYEKTFVRLNAEKLIDKPCKIRNNCNYTNIIFDILPEGKKEIVGSDNLEYEELVAGRISKIVDSYNDLSIREREIKMRNHFTEGMDGFEHLYTLIFRDVCSYPSMKHVFLSLLEIAHDFRKYKYTVAENFIMTELIPFKFEDFDIYNDLHDESNLRALSSLWNVLLENDLNEDSKLYVFSTLNSIFNITNAIALDEFFDYFSVNGYRAKKDSIKERSQYSVERSVKIFGDDTEPTNVPVLNEEDFKEVTSKVLNIPDIENIKLSFDIDEDELCILKKEYNFDLAAQYMIVGDNKREIITKIISDDIEFILFKILNTKKNIILGLSTDKSKLAAIPLSDNKYLFTEF